MVPVHDVRPWLPACLDSLLGQPFGDLEVIAVDDASTDGSDKILDEYAARDPRLQVLHLPRNVGLGGARNAGLAAVRGRYVLFVDSDDLLADDVLGALCRRIEAAGAPDLVLLGFVRFEPDGAATPDPGSQRLLASVGERVVDLAAAPGLLELFPVAWNKAYRRDFLTAHAFAFADGFYEDLPWTYPALISAATITAFEPVGYRYRQRPGTILRTGDRRQLDIVRQYERVFDWLDAHPEHERWRVPLYDRFTRHVTWMMELPERVPPDLRRALRASAGEAFRRRRPVGFRPGSRTAAAKLALVERGPYLVFRAAQWLNARLRRARP